MHFDCYSEECSNIFQYNMFPLGINSSKIKGDKGTVKKALRFRTRSALNASCSQALKFGFGNNLVTRDMALYDFKCLWIRKLYVLNSYK